MLSLQGTGFLLAALCEQLGLCLSPEARRRLVDQAPPDAERFIDAVFSAEELERVPSHRARYQDALALARRAFADHSRADNYIDGTGAQPLGISAAFTAEKAPPQ